MNWKFETGRIYSTDEHNELLAETTFVYKNKQEIDIEHTYVSPALRGQGVAGQMMETVVAYLRTEGLKATASCSYANSWLKKNAEIYADVIAADFGKTDVACQLSGKH